MDGMCASLLRLDPDLAQGIDGPRAEAEAALRAAVREFPEGRWDPGELRETGLGLLIVRGLIARRVSVGTTVSTELLGPTDILRPWDEGLPPTVRAHSGFTVLYPLRVAVLDAEMSKKLAWWPGLEAELLTRMVRRSRTLAYLMAISSFVRVEDRLQGALWYLAGRWGRPTEDGIVIPFRLSHEVLAEVVGARRPAVTRALGQLQEQHLLVRHPDRLWELRGDPPVFE